MPKAQTAKANEKRKQAEAAAVANRTTRNSKFSVMSLADLVPDPNNLREHNARELDAIEQSLKRNGAFRSIGIDKDLVIRAGNATVEAAINAGFEHVLVIPSDGKTLVAVMRPDMTEEQLLDAAIADNRTAELATGWKAEPLRGALATLEGLAPGSTARHFYPDELKALEPPKARVDNAETTDVSFTAAKSKTVTCPNCAHEFDPKAKAESL